MLLIYAVANEEHPYVSTAPPWNLVVAIVIPPLGPQPFPDEGSAADPRLIPSPAEGHLPFLSLFRAFSIEMLV
jgi:hypothetical protein